MELSHGALAAWQFAAGEAKASRHQEIGAGHLLAGLCSIEKLLMAAAVGDAELPPDAAAELRQEWRVIRDVMAKTGLQAAAVRGAVRERIGTGDHGHGEQDVIHRSEVTRGIFERAAAMTGGARRVSAQDLLAALVEGEHEPVPSALRDLGADPSALGDLLRGSSSRRPRIPPDASIDIAPEVDQDAATIVAEARDPGRAVPDEPEATPRPMPLLERYGRDLTALARDGKLAPPVGRRAEMLEVARTLARQTKNNPVLVGDAGVGKTAIVEGLAWRIATGNPPPALQGRRIFELKASDLVAGTRYRGELEERLGALLDEVREVPEAVIFVDEVHTLVGAGVGEGGAMDAANILKPALARGELRLIGATTSTEYARHIERDAALERRFRPVRVAEPSAEETVEILEGIRGRLEESFGAAIRPEALREAVRLSVRYLPERRLPDKAIDLLEEACATLAVDWQSMVEDAEADPGGAGEVDGAAVTAVAARWTGIPLGELGADEAGRLREMGAALRERVVGQDAACDAVAQAVQRARLGLSPEGRPVGVLLFLGPTGVGKTELAKASAAFLHGTEKALVRIDMSEYTEAHSVSRLVGAPPGYVGHEDEGQLTGAVRRTPHCIVLVDEIEKAHRQVLDLFLQLFDEGRLTDARGRTVDATNALFVVTTNLGQEEKRGIGFHVRGSTEVRKELVSAGLRPEFVNRLDEVVVFRSLETSDLARIAEKLLEAFAHQLVERRGIVLRWEAAVPFWFAEGAEREAFGARELRRLFTREVEDRVAGLLLRDEVSEGHGVMLDVTRDALEARVDGDPEATR